MAAAATSVTHIASSIPESISPNSTARGLRPNTRKISSTILCPRGVFWNAPLNNRTPRKNAKVLSPKLAWTACGKVISPVKGTRASNSRAVTAMGASIRHQLRTAKIRSARTQ